MLHLGHLEVLEELCESRALSHYEIVLVDGFRVGYTFVHKKRQAVVDLHLDLGG